MPLDIEDAAVRIYQAVFEDRDSVVMDGQAYTIKRTSQLGLKEVVIEGYTFLEQNPAKDSIWGRLARKGHRILWVMKRNRYIAQVNDGVFHDFRR